MGWKAQDEHGIQMQAVGLREHIVICFVASPWCLLSVKTRLRTSLPTGRGPFGGCATLSDGQGKAARRNGRGQESSKRVYSIGRARAVVYV